MGQFTAFPVYGVPVQPRFQALIFTHQAFTWV